MGSFGYLKLLSFIFHPTAISPPWPDPVLFTEDMAEKMQKVFAFVTRQSSQYTMVYPRGTVSGVTANLAWSHNSDWSGGGDGQRNTHHWKV